MIDVSERRSRTAAAWAIAMGPGLVLALVAATRQGIDRGGEHRFSFAISAAASIVGCGLMMRAASARVGVTRLVARAALLVEAFVVGAQLFMRAAFQSDLDEVALRSIPTLGRGTIDFLQTQPVGLATSLGLPFLVALILPLGLARLAPTARSGARRCMMVAAGLAVVVTVGFAGRSLDRALSPDVLFAASLARAFGDHPLFHPMRHGAFVPRVAHERTPIPVPPLKAANPRNVLLVLGESIRADVTCIAPTASCEATPFTNAALPNRIPLLQMRALDSTTAISLGVLLTGLPADASSLDVHSAPLAFEYARAAGIHTAYWTSQDLGFGGAGRFLAGIPFDRHASGRDIGPGKTCDEARLFARALPDLLALPSPYFAVVHLYNTHHPYLIDPHEAPFQPETSELAGNAVQLKNRYLDAVYHQDHLLAEFIRAVRASPAGRDTVIVYLSDHGEGFYETETPIHALSVEDTEIHIPTWIDAPTGTLAPEEEIHLRGLAKTPVTMLDVLPTLLDLLGLGSAPPMDRFRNRMPGASLVGPLAGAPALVHLTNCPELWACPVMSWGVMRGTLKYIFRGRTSPPTCYDVASDPRERHDLGREACASLIPDFDIVDREGRAASQMTERLP